MTSTQERSVPQVVFTTRGRSEGVPDSDARRYNYFTPQKRSRSHYEDVTVEVQPDPRHYLAQGWLTASRRKGGYPLEWTTLKAWGSDRPEPRRGPGRAGRLYPWPALAGTSFRDPTRSGNSRFYAT